MRLPMLLALLAAPTAAQACPKGPDNTAARAAIIADLQKARTAQEAAGLMTQFWLIQMRAPDTRSQAMLNAAVAQRNQGDLQGSLDTLNQLVKTCPDFIEGYNQRAFDEYLTARNAAALKDANHVLAHAPDHIGALSGKALVLFHLGRDAEARKTLRAALKLDPWLPERKLLGQSL